MASVCVAFLSFLAAVLSRVRFLLFLLPPFRFTRFILSIEVRFDDDGRACAGGDGGSAGGGAGLLFPLGPSAAAPPFLFFWKKAMLLMDEARDRMEDGRRPAKFEVDLRREGGTIQSLRLGRRTW